MFVLYKLWTCPYTTDFKCTYSVTYLPAEVDKYLNLKSPTFKFSRCQNISIAIIAGCIFCFVLAFVTTVSSCPITSGCQTINLNVQLVTEVRNYQWHFTLNFWTCSSASLHFPIFSFYYIRDHMPADFIGP